MSVEIHDFIDTTRRSNCCGAAELESGFCVECREHAEFDRQCENFEQCGNWIEANAYLDDECQACEDAWNRKNPHPLDIAEHEEMENRSAGLEEPWWVYR